MTSMREWLKWGAPLTAVLMLAGCGGGEGGEEAPAGEAGGGEGAAVENPVDPATAGTINGRVTFTGTPAAPEPIDMMDEPTCADAYEGGPMKETAIVGDDGGLANVFVYVKSGLDGMQFPAGEAVVLDQENCMYDPHVVGLMTGQQLTVRNSDPVLHNVNATPDQNRGFNRSQPQEGMEFQTSFTTPEVMIPVRCDVHGWMEAYIGVTGHPYNAVTDDGGSFTLADLPPGEYEVEAWHEAYGTSTQMVTVPESGEVEVTFEFNEQMAGRAVPMGPALIVDHETGTLRREAAPAASSRLP